MRVVFIGSGDIGLPTLQWLLSQRHAADPIELVGVVAQPDKPVGRKQELTPPATKRLALEHGIAVLQPKRMRNPEAVAEIAALAPDLIVVMAYGQILPKSLLDLPSLGCLNLHASLLPAYRGAAPIQAAILNGDNESGVAVMWMDEGLDTGDVLLMRTLPIDPDETGGTLHDRLGELAPIALADAIDLIRQQAAPRIPQDNALATYAAKLSRESGVIDWSAPSTEIELRIRAMNPWPAASTLVPGPARPLSLKLFAATALPEYEEENDNAAPGSVLHGDKHGLLVKAGSGAVLLREVQLEGKRRMSAGEFLMGTPLAQGVQLGKP